MDEVALYTAYYSPYHMRAAAEAESAAAPPRKRQCVVCMLLAFGAACGISTVAVGFYAHNPVITWPVVAVGLLGVVAGVTLAQIQITGGFRRWSPAPSAAQQQAEGVAVGAARGAAAAVPLFHTPMYAADALDLEEQLGLAPRRRTETEKTAEDGAEAGPEAARARARAGVHDAAGRAMAPTKAGGAVAGAAWQRHDGGGGAVAVAAVGCGAVACGLPAAGAHGGGWVDTRPVLVLQPHPLWVRYFGHLPAASPPPQEPEAPGPSQQQQQQQPACELVQRAAAAPPLNGPHLSPSGSACSMASVPASIASVTSASERASASAASRDSPAASRPHSASTAAAVVSAPLAGCESGPLGTAVGPSCAVSPAPLLGPLWRCGGHSAELARGYHAAGTGSERGAALGASPAGETMLAPAVLQVAELARLECA